MYACRYVCMHMRIQTQRKRRMPQNASPPPCRRPSPLNSGGHSPCQIPLSLHPTCHVIGLESALKFALVSSILAACWVLLLNYRCSCFLLSLSFVFKNWLHLGFSFLLFWVSLIVPFFLFQSALLSLLSTFLFLDFFPFSLLRVFSFSRYLLVLPFLSLFGDSPSISLFLRLFSLSMFSFPLRSSSLIITKTSIIILTINFSKITPSVPFHIF